MNSILFLGIAVFLSLADLAVSETKERGKRESYKVAFWLATGIAAAALIIMFLGVKIGKAKSDLTAEEKEELENELVRRRTNQPGLFQKFTVSLCKNLIVVTLESQPSLLRCSYLFVRFSCFAFRYDLWLVPTSGCGRIY